MNERVKYQRNFIRLFEMETVLIWTYDFDDMNFNDAWCHLRSITLTFSKHPFKQQYLIWIDKTWIEESNFYPKSQQLTKFYLTQVNIFSLIKYQRYNNEIIFFNKYCWRVSFKVIVDVVIFWNCKNSWFILLPAASE